MGKRRGGEDLQVVRNRSNQVSGWLMWVLLTGVWCLNDPMGLVYPEPGWATRWHGLGVTAIFAAGSALGVLISSVPYVGLGPRTVVVQNALVRHVIPRELIAGVSDRGRYPDLCLTDGRRVRLSAAERSTSMQMRGVSVVDEQRLRQSEVPARSTGPARVVEVWSVPVHLKVVGAFWGVVAVVGSIFGRYV